MRWTVTSINQSIKHDCEKDGQYEVGHILIVVVLTELSCHSLNSQLQNMVDYCILAYRHLQWIVFCQHQGAIPFMH